jgi:hypothetical protein
MHEQTSHDPLFAILALLMGLTTAWLAGNFPFENIELAEFFHGIWSDYIISFWEWMLGSTKKDTGSCAKTIITSCHEAGEDAVHGKDQLGQAQTFTWETGACLVGASYCCLKEQCLW